MDELKFSLITSFLSQTKDRFHSYNEPKTLEEKYRLVGQMKGVKGIESVFPYEVKDPVVAKRLAQENDLVFSAVNVNVKGEPEFRDGGLTSNDPKTRQMAIRFIKETKDFAYEVGADKVTCCPLSDGYEFSFHNDYRQKWGYMVESLKEAALYRPEVPLFIEYKPSETRGRCYVESATKTLVLLHEIGLEAMGVTLDFGHSLYGGEQPAEVLTLLSRSPWPYYIHINDNNRRWDWDLMVGTHNYIDYLEFLYYLRKDGYSGWYTSDTSPTRWDIKETFEMNARVTQKMWNLLDRVDTEEFEHLLSEGEYLQTWKFLEKHVYGL